MSLNLNELKKFQNLMIEYEWKNGADFNANATLGNKFQLNFDQNMQVFFEEDLANSCLQNVIHFIQSAIC